MRCSLFESFKEGTLQDPPGEGGASLDGKTPDTKKLYRDLLCFSASRQEPEGERSNLSEEIVGNCQILSPDERDVSGRGESTRRSASQTPRASSACKNQQVTLTQRVQSHRVALTN